MRSFCVPACHAPWFCLALLRPSLYLTTAHDRPITSCITRHNARCYSTQDEHILRKRRDAPPPYAATIVNAEPVLATAVPLEDIENPLSTDQERDSHAGDNVDLTLPWAVPVGEAATPSSVDVVGTAIAAGARGSDPADGSLLPQVCYLCNSALGPGWLEIRPSCPASCESMASMFSLSLSWS